MTAGGWLGWNVSAHYSDNKIADIRKDLESEKKRALQEKIDSINALEKLLADERKRGTVISKELKHALAKNKILRNTAKIEVENEIKKPVYSECIVPDSGVSVLNNTIRRYNQQRKENDTP